MPNGTYGRAVPRLALAVAEYRARFGAWPTHAHGSGVLAIVQPTDGRSHADDIVEHRAKLADKVRSRLICDGSGGWIEVSGPAGRCAYGLVEHNSPEVTDAYRWLYGEGAWWAGAEMTSTNGPKVRTLLEPQDDAPHVIVRESSSEGQVAAAEAHFRILQLGTDRLRELRDQFAPIYAYYFPQRWVAVLSRVLRLSPQSDFSRYRPQLQNLRDSAWRIVDDARAAFEAVAELQIDSKLKYWAQLAYKQIYYDGTVIILMNEWTNGMEARDPECAKYFAAMKELSRSAHENLVQMQAAGRSR